MAFHRYVTPTYFGGLPVGYDLINVTSGGTGSGGSAFADDAKSGSNPNVGTYFVAFGEDATSSNANRGLRALAQNTDVIDDLLHRDLAQPVRTNDATAGGPISTIVLPTSTFIGSAGYTTSVADLARLFSILDSSDNEITVSGTKVTVASVTLGSGDVIGGGGANGSFSGNTVTLNISPSIPTSTVYRVYYGTRTNLATLPADAFTTIKVRNAEEVPAAIEIVLAALHGAGLAWNDTWTSTIFDIALGGLNERYNRARTTPRAGADVFPPENYWATSFDDEGAGGWIIRRGPALTVYSSSDTDPLSDPLNALMVGKNFDTDPLKSGGTVGFAYYGTRLNSTFNADESATGYTPGGAGFMSLWPHDFGTGISAVNYKTKVTAGSSCTLSLVGAFNANTGEAIVQLSGSDFFKNGSSSAVSTGYDLLEIHYLVSGVDHYETFVIVSLGSSTDPSSTTKCRVRRLNGTVPDFSAATGVAVRWISTTFAIGDGGGRFHRSKLNYNNNIAVKLDTLFFQVPQTLSTFGNDDNVVRTPPSFSAQNNLNGSIALQWGGFADTVTFTPSFHGQLLGDGGISTSGDIQCGDIQASIVALTGITMISGTAQLFDLQVTDFVDLSASNLRRRMRRNRVTLSDADHTVGPADGDRFLLGSNPASPRTITLRSTGGGAPGEGETVEFLIHGLAAPAAQYTFQREDTTIVATAVGSASTSAVEMWAQFEFVSGVWRLGPSSGGYRDTTPANVGIVAGAGA